MVWCGRSCDQRTSSRLISQGHNQWPQSQAPGLPSGLPHFLQSTLHALALVYKAFEAEYPTFNTLSVSLIKIEYFAPFLCLHSRPLYNFKKLLKLNIQFAIIVLACVENRSFPLLYVFRHHVCIKYMTLEAIWLVLYIIGKIEIYSLFTMSTPCPHYDILPVTHSSTRGVLMWNIFPKTDFQVKEGSSCKTCSQREIFKYRRSPHIIFFYQRLIFK